MKIETSLVKKLIITEIESLDPIAVYLEDFGVGKGKIIITCFNDSWSYYWGAMGQYNLAQFIIKCDNDYLATKLSSYTEQKIDDYDALEDYAKKHIIKRRRANDIGADEARTAYDDCVNLIAYKDEDSSMYGEVMYSIFGDDWWNVLPKKVNPKYKYLCKILDVVREALNETQAQNSD
jgi:hypothetical protein